MYNKKWKKLSKRFACALALAMIMSVNPAWADAVVSDDKNTLTITNETVDGDYFVSDNEVSYYLKEFPNVVIKMENTTAQTTDGPIELWGNEFDIPDTNLTIKLNGKGSNLDGFHVAAGGTYSLNNFDAEIHTQNSDAINMSHDVKGDATLTVNGNLTATVDNGNGIRANGSRNGKYTSTLMVNGTTDITLNAGSVGQEFSIGKEDAISAVKHVISSLNPLLQMIANGLIEAKKESIPDHITGTASYNTAAVYAGNSASEFVKESWIEDGKTKGKGVVNLNGATKITLEDGGSYGVYAGKNGSINVNNNLTITSKGNGGYGVAARDLNLIYGEAALKFDNDSLQSLYEYAYALVKDNLPDGFLDPAPNTFGSYVTLKGDENTITMGAGGKALYASGRSENYNDKYGNSNTISSGDGDIGYLNATGDVAADDGGRISLWLRDHLSVTGSVSAESGGTVEFITLNNGNGNTITSTAQRTTSASGEEITFTNALYADGENSSVEITAGNGAFNEITTKTDGADESSKERTVWAANRGSVKLTGVTSITATAFDRASNSAGIAIAAGTDDWAKNAHEDDAGEIIFDVTDADRSHVYLNYGDAAGTASSVTGDIVSGYGGSIRVAKAQNASQASAMNFTGNALAANGGTLTLDLGGGYWSGRADDYKDAENETWKETHTGIFAPQFSNGILRERQSRLRLLERYRSKLGNEAGRQRNHRPARQ